MAKWMILVCALIGAAASESCKNPRVEAAEFTSRDATIVSAIGYIVEFTLACDSPVPEGYTLYAEVDGEPLTAARIAQQKYQVSWTEEVGKAKTGTRSVHVYDEEGWGALRRARRSGQAATQPLVTVSLHHPGSYSGPWVNSEIVAAVAAILIAYAAIRQKSKLTA